MMKQQLIMLLAAAATVLSTGPALADLGDQLFKLVVDDAAVATSSAGPSRSAEPPQSLVYI